MEVHRLPLPPLGANCYLLKGAGGCLILDPGGDPELVLRACRELAAPPAAVLLTHGHFDHVGGLSGLLAEVPQLPVFCHSADLEEPDKDLFPLSLQLGSHSHTPLAGGETLDLAGLRVAVLHTPGHSRGSCCFQVGDALFTGDTLFRFSIGRTDFPGGDSAQMAVSLARLVGLDGDLAVYPGHDSPTTLDAERRHNPYLQGGGPR